MSGLARSRVTRGQSCTVCYQRKVKCDGKRPCSTCVKTGRLSECRDSKLKDSTVTQANRDLLMRLRRYEALLVANGVAFDAQPDAAPPSTASTSDASEIRSRENTLSDDGKMIIQSGYPRFVESPIWNHIESELTEYLPSQSEDEESELAAAAAAASVSPDALLFGTHEPGGSLMALHPSISQVLQLWQIFLADFYPLVMVFHAPSIQQIISESIANLGSVLPKTEALLFSIYLSAVTSMSNQDCLLVLGEPKEVLLARYSRATQRSLMDAQFLQSNDVSVLQSLTLYLLASRRYVHAQSLWILAGVASRLAQTMGLHREHGLKHLSPYDAEVRRRLWWQISSLNYRLAQLSGATNDIDFGTSFDTRPPLNVHDSVLSPFMSDLPPESDGPTDMLFCTVRLEIGECLRKLKIIEKTAGDNPAITFAQKDKEVDELESRIEHKISRCDSSIPLHMLTLLLGRSAVCQKRLAIRQEANQRNQDSDAEPHDEDELFQMAIQIMMYDHLTFSTMSLRSYLWHVEAYFPFQAFVFVLKELMRRPFSEKTSKAWTRVIEAYEDHANMLDDKKNPLQFAIGNLTLRAWENRMASTDPKARENMAATHPVILKLQAQRLVKSEANLQATSVSPAMPMQISPSQEHMDAVNYGMGPEEMNYILSGVNDMQWPSWQQYS